jgi:hypothetical protein
MESNLTYIVIEDANLTEFCKEVSRAKKEGWHTTGGVFVIEVPGRIGDRYNIYYQAMEK